MELTIVEVEFKTRVYVKRGSQQANSHVTANCDDFKGLQARQPNDCELNVLENELGGFG